jgi:hypothetical protein
LAKKPRNGIRAVSIYRNYGGPNAQDEKKMVLASGQEQILQKGLMAEPWRHGDVTEWERLEAMRHFDGRFRGLTHDENPVQRLSTFDSLWAQQVNGWTDDERVTVEEAVKNGPGNGIDYIVVDRPAAPKPWPAYDKLTAQGRRTIGMVAEKIAETTRELELDPQHVILYERENENRPEVIAALEALTAPAKPDEELVQA